MREYRRRCLSLDNVFSKGAITMALENQHANGQPAMGPNDLRDASRASRLASEYGEKLGLAEQFRRQATTHLSGQKDRAVQGLSSLVHAVRETGSQLRNKDQVGIAGYVESTADQIDGLARQIGDKDVRQLIEDAQRFARRQPAVFLGLSFGLGLLGARFLKSSRPQTNTPRRPATMDKGRGNVYGSESYGRTYGARLSESGASRSSGTSGVSSPPGLSAEPTAADAYPGGRVANSARVGDGRESRVKPGSAGHLTDTDPAGDRSSRER